MASEVNLQGERTAAGNEVAVASPEGNSIRRASGMTLGDLIHRISRHGIAAIVTFAVVFTAVCAYTLLATPQYTATSQLYVAVNVQSLPKGADVNSINTTGSYIATQITSYPKLATTETVLQPVINDLGLNESVGSLAQSVQAVNPTSTAFVNITVTNPSAKQAAAIANSIAASLSNVVSTQLGQTAKEIPIKLSLVQQATQSASPSTPNVRLNLLIAVLLGIVLAIVAALLKDIMATRIEEPVDFADIIDSPIMGRLPTDAALNATRPVVITEPDGVLAEEFRRIRTSLSFMAPVEGTSGRLIVVTSISTNEGKTTFSTNIAAALAENGTKVLLVDADLRRPSISDKLGLEGGAGLAHVLSGQAGVKDIIQRYWKQTLHIMPAGPKVANASVLLNSDIMKELLAQALRQYEYVIVDTSPMSVANDATVFGQMADGLVLVSGRGVTLKRDLKDVAVRLRLLNIPIIGIVFNYAQANKRPGDYDRHHYKTERAGHEERHARREA